MADTSIARPSGTWYGNNSDAVAVYTPAFLAIACIAAILFFLQLRYCQKLKILPAFLLPFCSFFICFKNVVLWRTAYLSPNSDVSEVGYVFSSFVVPLMITIIYEAAYRLHEARSAHFLFIPFDQNLDVNIPALLSLWAIRIIALGLFVMNIIVYFGFYSGVDDAIGRGGFITLSQQPQSTFLCLSLIPPIFLSALGLVVSLSIYRYGNNVSLGLIKTRRWRIPLISVLGYIVGEIFDTNVYLITSSSGEIFLLMGLTLLIRLVQQDLAFAGQFADFLHRSNEAFSSSVRSGQQSTQYKGVIRTDEGESRSLRKPSGMEVVGAGGEHRQETLLAKAYIPYLRLPI